MTRPIITLLFFESRENKPYFQGIFYPIAGSGHACFAILAVTQKPEQASQPPHPPSQPLPHVKDSILICIRDRIHDSDRASISVSYDLESDTAYNRLLMEYIRHYEFGGVDDWPANRLASVVNRESFLRMILLWYGKGQMMNSYPGISYNGDSWRLEEIGKSLLFSAYDCCHERFYAIADTLLTQDDFDAARSLWDSADLKKLPSLNGFVARVSADNFVELADLAAFFHNNVHFALRDSCLARAGKVKGHHKQFLQLTGLIAKNKSFDYLTYSELLFNDY